MVSSGGGGGGGGGGLEVVSGSTEFCTFNYSIAAIGFHGTLFLSSIFFFLNLLIGFYPVNLVGNVKMH